MRPDGKARRARIPGVFERGATQPAGMQRRPNAAGVSPRAVKASNESDAMTAIPARRRARPFVIDYRLQIPGAGRSVFCSARVTGVATNFTTIRSPVIVMDSQPIRIRRRGGHMIQYGGKELADAYRTVRANTIK